MDQKDDLQRFGSALRSFLKGLLADSGSGGGSSQSRVEKNKQTLLKFKEEIFFQQRFEKLDQYVTKDIVDHVARPGDPPGIQGVHMRFKAWLSSFKFADHVKPLMIGEGDYLAYTYVNKGHHTGNFMGVEATGAPVDVNGLGIVRFEGDKIAEHWMAFDTMDVAQQIGAEIQLLAPRGQRGGAQGAAPRPPQGPKPGGV